MASSGLVVIVTRNRRGVVGKCDKQRNFKRAGTATLLVTMVASWLTVDSGSVLYRWVSALVNYILRDCGVHMHDMHSYSTVQYSTYRVEHSKPGGQSLAGMVAWYRWYLEETCGSHAGQVYSTTSWARECGCRKPDSTPTQRQAAARTSGLDQYGLQTRRRSRSIGPTSRSPTLYTHVAGRTLLLVRL